MQTKKLVGSMVLAAMAMSLSTAQGQVAVSATKDDGRSAISADPWVPPARDSGADSGKIIYGDDDRLDVYEVSDPRLLAMAASTVALISSGRMVNNGNGTWNINPSAYTRSGVSACPGEPFGTQPVAPNCSGFLAGEDIVVTAGHCYNSFDFNNTYIVFGFDMLDASTPVLTVPDSHVYRGVEILGTALESGSGDDYTVIRLERIVTVPDAVPLEIRRSGNPPPGTPVGMIGHPTGLPKKIAFGEETTILSSDQEKYFVANVDAYGGNSGSPVFNQVTGLVEGVLVRGEPDYWVLPTCFFSNALPDVAGSEEVSKAARFAPFVPVPGTGAGFVSTHYSCSSTVEVMVRDTNHVGASLTAQVTTGAGDFETVTLFAGNTAGVYTGSLPTAAAGTAVTTGDGVLQGNDNDLLVIIYDDPNGPENTPVTRTGTAVLDCEAPLIANIQTISLPNEFTVLFDTSEPVASTLLSGGSCGTLFPHDSNVLGFERALTRTNLSPAQYHRFRITATDAAGNSAESPGGCLYAETSEIVSLPFEDDFDPAAEPGWTVNSVLGSDTWLVVANGLATSGPNGYRLGIQSGAEQDVRLVSPVVTDADALQFMHAFSIEAGFDGAVLEISTNGGASWTDLGPSIREGAYNGGVARNVATNAIAERACWTGPQTTMTRVTVDLRDFPGSKQVRWRFSADNAIPSSFWFIDDVRFLELGGLPVPLSAETPWQILP